MTDQRYAYRRLAQDCHIVIDTWNGKRCGVAHFTEFEAVKSRDYMNANWQREADTQKHKH